ncbi:Qat anti-phage system TatD family nuclease QatD [Larkinella humicola]|uniref:TatD family deoxyribonuclease n=1 Tax=Larkinella humicola TaxID=2607654 RepID=A0A5N1J7K1_9BACT|nr:Qat anti-phage system TatD family nuclease QatD [Larkinella humicola]KAA9341157.1 TatD family deoxyribonuclease [Larkinella humicola]
MNHLLDTHFHLDLWPRPNISTLIEQSGIYTIAVTNTPSVYFHTEKIAANSKYIRAALGLHPQLASERQRELPIFMQLLPTTRYIGEIGLDDRTCTDFEIQKKLFISIINACADARNKILSIHSRRADKEVIDVIGEQFPGKIILHWFSGSLVMLERGVDAGFYFSVNHAMANSSAGKKLIQAIPSDRLLTESDGPFVESSRQPCSPLSMPSLLQTLVSVRNDLENEVIASNQIFANFRRILS